MESNMMIAKVKGKEEKESETEKEGDQSVTNTLRERMRCLVVYYIRNEK